MQNRVALIGFGEAGATFAEAGRWGSLVRAFDILPLRMAVVEWMDVIPARSAGEALADANMVLSLVTAGNALDVAWTCAPLLASGTVWCDMNSVAPETKKAAAEVINAAGGRYVDVAVLAPVKPAALSVPLLLSGPAAHRAEQFLRDSGFLNMRVVGDEVGRAAAIKMIRSVMIKGIEALTDEMMAGAQAAGVTDEVLASLDDSEKQTCWTKRSQYNLERMAAHGLRRAAEMEEAARTLTSLGVRPIMTEGTVRRQREQGLRGMGNRT